MDEEMNRLAESLVGSYANQAAQARNSRCKKFKELLRHKKLPNVGWDELTIQAFLTELSSMDSNNFLSQVGAGEREGRVACPLVAGRHLHMAHGIGRSGDISAIQPKAAGSSLLNRLAASVSLDAIRIAGIHSCQSTVVVPTATGVALMLCLLAWKKQKPSAQYVVWSRIDQKSCFKAILTAGLIPLIVDTIGSDGGDVLRTDITLIRKHIENHGSESVLCVLTTTSCFAPRAPDDIESVAALCKEYGIRHLVNNAYGLQSSKCCHLIEQASKHGRVDAFVQSTDKNFRVPVGGAIIAGFEKSEIETIAQSYPGRGSSVPSLDLLTTLLWQGKDGWKKSLADRKENFGYLKSSLSALCSEFSERLLDTPENTISLALTLKNLDDVGNRSEITGFGSRLFSKCITGARVVPLGEEKSIEGHSFVCWGAHSSHAQSSYLNVASAIGMTRNEIDSLISCLRKTFKEKMSTRNQCNQFPTDENCKTQNAMF